MIVNISLALNGKIPERQTNGSAGYDLFAANEKNIEPNKPTLIELGFCMKLPLGFEAQIRSRSGLAIKHNVIVFNSPGTIDSDYIGEVCVILMNFGIQDFLVKKHMRVAQMLFAKVEKVRFITCEQLKDTSRSIKGFGSTGL